MQTACGGTTTVTRVVIGEAGNAWADLNGSSSLTTRRIYLDDTDSVAARISGSMLSYYLPDRLGSVRNQTDASGVLSNTITYDAFGKVTSETSPSNGDRFKYTGRELDSETGLQFNHARYYNPATGTWTTADPSGFTAGDPNLYRYVRNEPTDRTDSTGLFDERPQTEHEADIRSQLQQEADSLSRERAAKMAELEKTKKELEAIEQSDRAFRMRNPGYRPEEHQQLGRTRKDELESKRDKLRRQIAGLDAALEENRKLQADLRRGGNARLPSAQMPHPDGSVSNENRNKDPRVLEQERAGGRGGPLFLPGPDGKPVFLPDKFLNRPTPAELDAAFQKEYLRRQAREGVPQVALAALEGVLFLASFVPGIGQAAMVAGGILSGLQGDPLGAALGGLAAFSLLGSFKKISKAAADAEAALLVSGKRGQAVEELLVGLRALQDPEKFAAAVARMENELAQALKSGKKTATEIEQLLIQQGMTKAQAAAKVKELEALAAARIRPARPPAGAPVANHHGIPHSNSIYNHEANDLVRASGVDLKDYARNQRNLINHVGRHARAYHIEVRRRLDAAWAELNTAEFRALPAAQQQALARARLDAVIDGIFTDLGNGSLWVNSRPVWLP